MSALFARRRALSFGTVAVAAVGFVLLTVSRIHSVHHPYAWFPALSEAQARLEARACAYRTEGTEEAGFVDTFVGGPERVAAAGSLTLEEGRVGITGWTVFQHPVRPADGMLAFIDGRCVTAAYVREHRADVATALKTSSARDSGFTLVLEQQLLPKGRHRVEVYAIDARHRARARVGGPSLVTIR